MAFRYDTGFVDINEVFEGLKDSIENSYNTPSWDLVFTNSQGSTCNFNLTNTNTEQTTNKVYVLRSKLSNNTTQTNGHEYAYIILEKDVSLNRVIVRSCTSFAGSNNNTNVTSLVQVNDAELFLDNLGTDNAISFCGDSESVTLSLRSNVGVSAITLAELRDYPIAFDQNNAQCLFKTDTNKAFVNDNVGFEGKNLDIFFFNTVDTTLQTEPDGATLLTEIGLASNNEFVGFMKGVYISQNNLANYDIINISNPNSPILRVFQASTGIVAVNN